LDTYLPLSLQHRHALLLADRTRDVRTITAVVTEVLTANSETTPLDIETALRHADSQAVGTITEALAANPKGSLLDIETAIRAAASQTYLVANSTTAGFQIVLGRPAWHAALADAGVTVEQNWAALARKNTGDAEAPLNRP
jgi:hypothetical protein